MKTLLLAATLCIAAYQGSMGSASAQISQAQTQQWKNEWTSIKVALAADDKCALFGSVSRAAAQGRFNELTNIFHSMGAEGLEDRATEITKIVNADTCAQMAKTSDIKGAKDHANLIAGMHLLAWQELYRRLGKQPNGNDRCDNTISHRHIKLGVEEQKHLIKQLQKHKNYEMLWEQARTISMSLEKICNNSGTLSSQLGTLTDIIPQTVSHVYLHHISDPDIGMLDIPSTSSVVTAFRGGLPMPQTDTRISWAVRRRTKEAGDKSAGTFNAPDSRIDYGFLQDKRFLISVQTSLWAEFKEDIYKTVIIEATASGQIWNVSTRTSEFKAANYAGKISSAQFIMGAMHSNELWEALQAGSDLHVSMVHKGKNEPTTHEVETTKNSHFITAMTYAFAPKIAFE